MLIQARRTVVTSKGTLTLQAWDSRTADAYLLDLLAVQSVLDAARDDWHNMRTRDVEKHVWDAFWRLVRASLVPGSEIPGGLGWRDRVSILTAMWELNDVQEVVGELNALRVRAEARMARLTRRA